MRRVFTGLCLSIAVCATPVTPGALANHDHAADVAETIVVATYAYPDRDRAAAIGPLAAYLGRMLQREARVRVLPSPSALVDAMQRGEIDVAVPNLHAFLKAQAGEGAIATLPVPDVPPAQAQRYRSVIVSRQPMTPAQLKQRAGSMRIVLVGADSASGGFVPLSFLSTQGLTSDDFAALGFAGSHAAALAAVHEGRADVAALAADVFDARPQGLHEVWRSPVIPPGPLLCRESARVPCPRIADLLRSVDRHDPAVMAGLRYGWPEFGDAVRFIDAPPGALEAMTQYRARDMD